MKALRYWLIRLLGGHVPSIVCDQAEREYINELLVAHIDAHRKFLPKLIKPKLRRSK